MLYLEAFDDIWIDCLNGDKYKNRKGDPSIFATEWNKEGIQVGTAVALFVRKEIHKPTSQIKFRSLLGKAKSQELLKTIHQTEQPISNYYQVINPKTDLGLPFTPTSSDVNYTEWSLLIELFPTFFPGVQTKRDEFVVDIDEVKLRSRVEQYFDSSISNEDMKRLCSRSMETTNRFNAAILRTKFEQVLSLKP